MSELDSLLARISELEKIIAARDAQLRVSMVDGLTGLLRREGFEERARTEISRHRRSKHHLSMFLLDLNSLKSVNDSQGHTAGDQLLKKFAQLLKLCIRDIDMVARTGGDEFMIFMPETKSMQAQSARCRLIEKLNIDGARLPHYHSVAIGWASSDKGFETYEDLVNEADRKMYEHKGEIKKRA